MKHLYRLWALFLVVVIFVPCQSGFAQAKKNIVILATGGTIAGAAPTGTQVGYTSGQVGIDTMINAVPGIKELANIKGEQISNVGSQDMSFEILLKLANRINELTSGDVDGIVITHGTDTMEESAYFLNLTVKTDKPVVLVGSMRPSTAVSADGPLNLYNAVAVAADPQSRDRGVLVVMNDHIPRRAFTDKDEHHGMCRRLCHRFVVSWVLSRMANATSTTRRPGSTRPGSEFNVSGVTKLPRVDIIYADVDMSPDLIDDSAKGGAKGIVIAGVGNGNMTQAAVEAGRQGGKEGCGGGSKQSRHNRCWLAKR